MGKYKKKPVVIEAELYQEGLEDGYVCYTLSGNFIGYYDKDKPLPKTNRKPAIKTLEGFHEITDGDYIITGIRGERYPCKADIFKETYEKVED
jgi:hypothetical protein